MAEMEELSTEGKIAQIGNLLSDLVTEVARVAGALEEIAELLDTTTGDDTVGHSTNIRRFIRTLDIGRE